MSKNTAPLGIKALVLVVAISLATGYVLYRNRSSSPPALPLAKEKQMTGIAQDLEGGPTPGESTPSDPVIMSSSKSEVIPAIEMTEELRRILMTSSKSGAIVPPVQIELPKQEPEKPRTILPGSKSMRMVDPPKPEPK